MTITPTVSRNYATSIFDQRTKYSRAQSPRNFNFDDLTHAIHSRPEPVYAVDDKIRLEDGTLRTISFRTYSASQNTWLYRLTTKERNRFNGVISTGNLTEKEVIDMDKSDVLPAAADSQKFADGWIVQFKSQRYELFQTWMNSDGNVAVFDKEIAIQFIQGMLMAYDSVRQWAVFRIRPYHGHTGEEWFFTLIQPDNQYAAAVSAFAEVQLSKIGLAGFNDEAFPIEYHHFDVGFLFVRNVIENWRKEYVRDSITGYSNPNRPKFSNGDILKLPTGFMRPVEFITPYWIKAGQIGFRYWFYVQGKQLVDYAQEDVEIVYDVEAIELDIEIGSQINLVKVAQTELAEQPQPASDIQCVLVKMQEEIDSLKSQNETLEKSLHRANKRVELIQAKEVQYHLEFKNKIALATALRRHAPDAWNEVKSQLHETIEYDRIVSPIMVENNESIRKINRLKDVLADIENACKNQSADLNDDYSWLGFMANMGLNGGYYSDELKARFGLVPKPQHDYSLVSDEL